MDEINEVWLFDCGEGTQNRILETTIRPRKVSKIFITHLHGDHIFGLPGFLSSRAFQANEEQTDLEIYGPQGIKSFVLTSLRVSGSRLPYRIHFHEFDQDSLGKILETDKFTVYAEELDHTIFCVGYRVMQKDLEGTLDAEKLKAAGVPFGPLFGKIKNGQDIVLEDGTEIKAADYISAPRPGKIITILGDTRKLMPVCVWLSMQMSLSMSPLMVKVMRKLPAIMATQPICRLRRCQQKREPNDSCSTISVHASFQRILASLRKMRHPIFENVHVVKDLEEVEI